MSILPEVKAFLSEGFWDRPKEKEKSELQKLDQALHLYRSMGNPDTRDSNKLLKLLQSLRKDLIRRGVIPSGPVTLYKGIEGDVESDMCDRVALGKSFTLRVKKMESWSRTAEGALKFSEMGFAVARVFKPSEVLLNINAYITHRKQENWDASESEFLVSMSKPYVFGLEQLVITPHGAKELAVARLNDDPDFDDTDRREPHENPKYKVSPTITKSKVKDTLLRYMLHKRGVKVDTKGFEGKVKR